MTQEEIDAIPDEVFIAAYDEAYPHNTRLFGPRQKIDWAQNSHNCQSIARLLMQLRAKDAEIAALKGVDPDLVAARKIAADYWREDGLNTLAAEIEAVSHDNGCSVQLALRGIKHGRGEG